MKNPTQGPRHQSETAPAARPIKARSSFFRPTNLPAVLAISVVIVGWIVAERQARKNFVQEQRSNISAQVAVVRADLEATVNGTIQLVRGLIATITTEPEMDQDRFAALAERLIADQRLLRNVAAAPDMVIRMMYPIVGNEQAIGLDYMRTPEQREAALRARDSGGLVLAGPVDLIQGGQGFVGRFPVFIPTNGDNSVFWGLVSAVMDLEVLYDEAGLSDDLPFSLTLTGRDALGGQGPAFFGPQTNLGDDPVISVVQLPTGTWQIAALPYGGWQSTPPTIWRTRALLLLAAGLLLIPSIQMGRLMDARKYAIDELKYTNRLMHDQMNTLKDTEAVQTKTAKLLRDSLQQQQEITERFQDVADISRSWVWEQDKNLRFTHVSKSFSKLSGLPIQSTIGKTRAEIYFNPEIVEKSADWTYLDSILKRREPFTGFIYRHMNVSGDEQWFQISGKPIFDENGKFCGYRGAGMEVTEIYRARSNAEAASQAKTMFLANMSHEIRTPLNGILGMAEYLRQVLPDPEHQRIASVIHGSGEGLLQILDGILDISKVESGKIVLDRVVFNPSGVVEKAVSLHRTCCVEKGLSLRLCIHPMTIVHRLGDPGRVEQIIQNLLGNAIKFTDVGNITITLCNAPDTPVKIVVQDTGIGMTPEQSNRIFEDFTQADGSIRRRFGGTGLGMSIVQRLVELMDGSIDVQSELHQGTTVTVTLPMPQAEEEPAIEPTVLADISGLRLLIADDTRSNLMVMQVMLRDAGVAVTAVENGAEAVKAWEDAPFDVILLDIAMPVLDGPAALKEMLSIANSRGEPSPAVIACTANVMTEQVEEYYQAGFVGFVPKPVRKADLVTQIAIAAGRK